jgi:hypothetical protein
VLNDEHNGVDPNYMKSFPHNLHVDVNVKNEVIKLANYSHGGIGKVFKLYKKYINSHIVCNS